jgi:UDP-3-O-[3-hydroxymyristoyl] glucosamine N-acyltransferase
MIPLQPHADWVKNFSHLRRLDAMAERVRELEKKLAEQDKTS